MRYSKNFSALFLVCLAAFSTSVMADRDRNFHSNFRGGHHHNHQGGGGGWLAPLVIMGVAGAAILGASHSSATQSTVTVLPPPVTYQPPPVVYAAPPQPPAHAMYFCGSVGQYFPNVRYCPEGWQLVVPQQR